MNVQNGIVMNTIWSPDLSQSQGAKYKALEAAIRSGVAAGQLPEGTRLPPVRDLAWKLQVTPGTVARAYKTLVDSGVLAAVVGRGTFVAGQSPTATVPFLMEPVPDGAINFRSSLVPDVGQARIVSEHLIRIGQNPQSSYLGYPKGTDDLALRQHMAAWIGADAHGHIDLADMVLCFGAIQAMTLTLMAILKGPTPVILTEDLAFPSFRHAAALLRATIRGVPFDADGILPDALDRIARETGAQVLCTSAEVHNPTTNRTSPERRAAIAAIAQRRGFQIIDDDTYGMAGGADPSYRLIAPERSWVLGSVAKSLSPELRLGAVIAPPGQGDRIRGVAQQQFQGLSRPLLDLATTLFDSGAAERIRTDVLGVINRRVVMTRETLGPFNPVLRNSVPFVWLPMPRGWRASTFLQAAEAQGIRIKAADEFCLVDGWAPNAVRLAIASESSDQRFQGALDKLAALLSTPPSDMEV